MKKIKSKNSIISVIICLMPMIAGAVMYGRLPEQMPIHWDINDVPDRYFNKTAILFGFPLIMAAVQGAVSFIVNHRLKDAERTPKIFAVVLWMFPALSVLVYTLTVVWSLGYTFETGKIGLFVVGLFFVLIGNYLPKMNYEDNKNNVHPKLKNERQFRIMLRISGAIFAVLGIVFMITAFFK